MKSVFILQKDLPDVKAGAVNYLESGYLVSKEGYVFSNQSNKYLKKTIIGKYITFCLYLVDKKVRKSLHVLLAECFIPNPNNLTLVRHLNDNPLDNRLENLAWGTKSDNMYDAVRNGLLINRPSPQGIKHRKAKLTDDKVLEIIKEFDSGVHYSKLGVKYNLTNSYAYKICHGQAWRHI